MIHTNSYIIGCFCPDKSFWDVLRGYEMGGRLEIKKIIWEMLMCDIIPYAR